MKEQRKCYFSKEVTCSECDIRPVDCCFHCDLRETCVMTCLIYERLKKDNGILIPKEER